jgi:hypothetical protein
LNFTVISIDAQDKRIEGDDSIDDTVRLREEDVRMMIEKSKKFIEIAEKTYAFNHQHSPFSW